MCCSRSVVEGSESCKRIQSVVEGSKGCLIYLGLCRVPSLRGFIPASYKALVVVFVLLSLYIVLNVYFVYKRGEQSCKKKEEVRYKNSERRRRL